MSYQISYNGGIINEYRAVVHSIYFRIRDIQQINATKTPPKNSPKPMATSSIRN